MSRVFVHISLLPPSLPLLISFSHFLSSLYLVSVSSFPPPSNSQYFNLLFAQFYLFQLFQFLPYLPHFSCFCPFLTSFLASLLLIFNLLSFHFPFSFLFFSHCNCFILIFYFHVFHLLSFLNEISLSVFLHPLYYFIFLVPPSPPTPLVVTICLQGFWPFNYGLISQGFGHIPPLFVTGGLGKGVHPTPELDNSQDSLHSPKDTQRRGRSLILFWRDPLRHPGFSVETPELCSPLFAARR